MKTWLIVVSVVAVLLAVSTGVGFQLRGEAEAGLLAAEEQLVDVEAQLTGTMTQLAESEADLAEVQSELATVQSSLETVEADLASVLVELADAEDVERLRAQGSDPVLPSIIRPLRPAFYPHRPAPSK